MSKCYLHFVKNKDVHKDPIVKRKICPFCNTINNAKYEHCIKCNKRVGPNQRNIVCHHCGYIGEMDDYKNNTEFVVTLLLWALLTFPAVIYYFLYRKKKICRRCGRMTRKNDYATE